MAYVDQYLLHPGVPDEGMRSALRAEFSCAELVHLALAAAHFNGFSRCAVALGGMPDKVPRFEMSVPD